MLSGCAAAACAPILTSTHTRTHTHYLLQWYAEGERINGRWAMAAVAGILFTDLLGKPKWFEAGSEEYWMPTAPLLAIEFLVLGFLELKRFQGWKETGTSGFLNAFPFDPAGEPRAMPWVEV